MGAPEQLKAPCSGKCREHEQLQNGSTIIISLLWFEAVYFHPAVQTPTGYF